MELTGGDWLIRHRGNMQIMAHLGNIVSIATIPGGKPSGAWAQSIGLALHQQWREQATRTKVIRVGETSGGEKRHRVSTIATRRELLSMFPPNPTAEEVGRTNHPLRAKEYWQLAIQTLSTGKHRIISFDKECVELRSRRQGWFDEWLDQPIEFRPTEHITEQVRTIKAGKPKSGKKHAVGETGT
jgi:hypothetical protein